MERIDVIRAHTFCTNNKGNLLTNKKCGCFYCLKIFHPQEISEWINEGSGTALCPYCGVDAVIGESSKYPITKEFLKEMNKHWF